MRSSAVVDELLCCACACACCCTFFLHETRNTKTQRLRCSHILILLTCQLLLLSAPFQCPTFPTFSIASRCRQPSPKVSFVGSPRTFADRASEQIMSFWRPGDPQPPAASSAPAASNASKSAASSGSKAAAKAQLSQSVLSMKVPARPPLLRLQPKAKAVDSCCTAVACRAVHEAEGGGGGGCEGSAAQDGRDAVEAQAQGHNQRRAVSHRNTSQCNTVQLCAIEMQ